MSNIGEIYDIQRELSAMNRELAYRTELHSARNIAEQQLQEVLSLEHQERNAEQARIAKWVEAQVLQNIAGKEDAIMKQCITDLAAIAKTA